MDKVELEKIELENALHYAELMLIISDSDIKTRVFTTIIKALRAELERIKA